jgi:hypothetical protein
MELAFVKIKDEDGYDIIINLDNVLYAKRHWDNSSYRLVFVDKEEINLTWKQISEFDKAIQVITE